MSKNIIKIFYAPIEVFEDIKERPAWALAFVVLLVITLISTAVLLPTVIQPSAIERIEETVPPERLEQALEFVSGTRFYITSLIGAVFGGAFMIFFQTAVFSLILVMIVKEIEFKKVLSLTVYTGLVTIAGAIIKIPLMLAKKSMEVYTNLVLFAPFAEKGTFTFHFLTQIDFFVIWAMALFATGISVVTNLERKKSYILVFVLWLIFAAGMAALTTLRTKGGG